MGNTPPGNFIAANTSSRGGLPRMPMKTSGAVNCAWRSPSTATSSTSGRTPQGKGSNDSLAAARPSSAVNLPSQTVVPPLSNATRFPSHSFGSVNSTITG